MLIYRTKILILLGISFVFVLSSQFSLILSLLLSLLFTFLGSCCFLWFSKLLVSVSSTNECAIAWFILFFRFFLYSFCAVAAALVAVVGFIQRFTHSCFVHSRIRFHFVLCSCIHLDRELRVSPQSISSRSRTALSYK